MKRELFQNVKVQPYTSAAVICTTAFLSCVVGAAISTAGDLTVKVTHSDDGENFEAVSDPRVFVDKATTGGEITISSLAAGDIVNIDVDLVGLKPYVKFTASGTASASATLAVVLGDSRNQPV